MRRRTLRFVALAAIVLVGCKKKVTDDRPVDDGQILADEMKRVQKGETVGEPLRAPKVVVDAQQIGINGHRVAGRRDLDTMGKIRRIDAVFDWMKGLREHWKIIHPSETFTPKVDLVLPEEIAFVDGASLVTTMAFAGYPTEITIQNGALRTTLDIAVPRPPSPAEEDKTTKHTFSLCKAGSWQALASTPPPIPRPSPANIWGLAGGDPGAPTAPWGRDDAPAAPAPSPVDDNMIRGVGWEPATDATSESVARKLCTTDGCTLFTVGANGPTTFKEALGVLAPALKARVAKPLPFEGGVRFGECSTEPPPPPLGAVSGGGSKKTPTLRLGAVLVSGGLAQDVVERIVRQNYGRFRLCYENGLRSNPNLQGRVAVKFRIGSQGEVTTTEDGGSDLPDAGVVSCVVRAFGGITFPQPTKGTVTVIYPIVFSPGE